jgi:DNA-binding response OmpR family regulator
MDMPLSHPVLLFEPDASLRASLMFALELEGYAVEMGDEAQPSPLEAHCLVIDQRLDGGDGLALLAALRDRGCTAPAILLSTNPTRRFRACAAAAGVIVVEKPLLGDALSEALHAVSGKVKAA